ncbi:MAG TPA: cupredoxin domain-containing protein [Terriglobia bacterium]|nr:cupredoxin domain-containing protein [Terriglobia bacterium]
MNARFQTIAGAALALTLVFPVTGLYGQESAPAPEGVAIQVSAKKYEFTPNVITVKQGDHVKLVITATDRDHGFKLAAFHIDQHLKKGVPTTVEFTADQAGTFPFQCSVFCGMGHGRMKGTLQVQPVSAPASSPSQRP